MNIVANRNQASDSTLPRVEKRRAIIDAAFIVFAREGYEGACVKDIAAQACVAKPTVYNHLTDKESLFRESIEVVSGEILAEQLALVDGLSSLTDMERFASEFLSLWMRPRTVNMRRLIHAESTLLSGADALRHPRLLSRAIADRLAHMALAGDVRIVSPYEAADQLLSLLIGPAEIASEYASIELERGQLDLIATNSVRVFLLAYRADVLPGGRDRE